MTRIRAVALASACIALTYCTVDDEPPPRPGADADGMPRGVLDQSFAELDEDGNGFLSRSEAADIPGLEDIFALADRDQDGRLSVPEFSHATEEGTTVSAEAARGPLFLALDTDENGRITPEEAEAVPQLERNFSTYDVDDSGGLDVQEYGAALDEGLTPPGSAQQRDP